MHKSGEVLKQIITLVIWLIVICAISFAIYAYVSPQLVQITNKSYSPIDNAYYDVNENELNGEWLEVQQYTVDKGALNRYEDLKEYYKGRDNPFGNLGGNREEIVEEIAPVIPDEEPVG